MKDDRLNKIFKEQKDFQKYFFDPENISEKNKIILTKEYVLSIHNELSEILNTLSWKLHRKEDKIKSENNTIEEIIDCFKFLLNLCIIWKIDADKFNQEFYRKTMVVRQRYNQEILKTIKSKDKVCAIDLDDTLAKSAEHFTKIYNKKYPDKTFKNKADIKKKLVLLKYENFKKYFRESGEKLNIPVKKEAKELCDFLKKEGFKIIIISARPYKLYNRIFPDTLQWLNKNKIQYDAVYFEKNKHIKILKNIPNLSFIIEDNPVYAKQIAEQNYKVYLLTNKSEDLSKNSFREKLKTNAMIIPIKKLTDVIKKKC